MSVVCDSRSAPASHRGAKTKGTPSFKLPGTARLEGPASCGRQNGHDCSALGSDAAAAGDYAPEVVRTGNRLRTFVPSRGGQSGIGGSRSSPAPRLASFPQPRRSTCWMPRAATADCLPCPGGPSERRAPATHNTVRHLPAMGPTLPIGSPPSPRSLQRLSPFTQSWLSPFTFTDSKISPCGRLFCSALYRQEQRRNLARKERRRAQAAFERAFEI
jgi:hypothetical protein